MRRLFFPCTVSTAASLTEVFDFVWPTAAAIWNLRWQVRGLIDAAPNIDQETLLGRFVNGSGIYGVNLRRACVERTWEQHQQRLAETLLTSAFALFESWCEQVLDILHLSTHKNVKALQFPTQTDGAGVPTAGVGAVLSKAHFAQSQMIVTSIYPELVRHPKHSLLQIESHLLCYRFFKEIRNCLMHNGGIADQKCVDAYAAFASVATAAVLGVKECPQHVPPTLSSPVALSLRGVVGMTEIILRVLVTLDSELAKNERAESVFLSSWHRVHGTKPKSVLPANIEQKRRRLRHLVRKLGLYSSNNIAALESFLRARHLVL
jgi:hypothetical protein